jgi:hypothetical protein
MEGGTMSIAANIGVALVARLHVHLLVLALVS